MNTVTGFHCFRGREFGRGTRREFDVFDQAECLATLRDDLARLEKAPGPRDRAPVRASSRWPGYLLKTARGVAQHGRIPPMARLVSDGPNCPGGLGGR